MVYWYLSSSCYLSSFIYFKLIAELWSYFKGTEQGVHVESDIRRGIIGFASDALVKVTTATQQNSNNFNSRSDSNTNTVIINTNDDVENPFDDNQTNFDQHPV